MATARPPERLDNIQGLRAVAAMLVVVLHCYGLGTKAGHDMTFLAGAEPWGNAGVDLFFVISGFIMASMVMVNNQLGAGAYAQLRHAEWDGLTFTDLVFPSFLWISGVATTLSTGNRLERGQSRSELLTHALRRAALTRRAEC